MNEGAKMGNKIIWTFLILLISFAACEKKNVARQPHIEKIDAGFQKEDEEFNKEVVEGLSREKEALTSENEVLTTEKEQLVTERNELTTENLTLKMGREEDTSKITALSAQLNEALEKQPAPIIPEPEQPAPPMHAIANPQHRQKILSEIDRLRTTYIPYYPPLGTTFLDKLADDEEDQILITHPNRSPVTQWELVNAILSPTSFLSQSAKMAFFDACANNNIPRLLIALYGL
jgi:hypothetical protein